MKFLLRLLKCFNISIESQSCEVSGVNSVIVYVFLLFLSYFIYGCNLYLSDKINIGYKVAGTLENTIDYQRIIIGVIIIPCLEEFMFRWGLKFSVSGAVILSFSIIYSITNWPLSSEAYNKYGYVSFIYYLIFCIVLIIILSFLVKYFYNSLEGFWKESSKVICLISIVSFSITHYSKYCITDRRIAVIYFFVILLPYFISGYNFSIIRLRYGIGLSIVAHGFSNLISMCFFVSIYKAFLQNGKVF